jgi:flagellar biosynthesis/type III secretory pathway protein FliH
MFRVLSEEEARKVVRWKAPDIGNNVADTMQIAKPAKTQTEETVTPVFRSQPSSSEAGTDTTTRRTPKSVSVEEPVYKPAARTYKPILPGHAAKPATTDIQLANPSAEMLKASYDDGYARGYAEGNAALHQQSVKELKTIVSALSERVNDFENASLEQEVLAMSLKIAELLVQREISIDMNVMQKFVQLGLQQLPATASGPAFVYLHPLDANVVRESIDYGKEVRIVDDTALDRGQCRIEAGASVVHAGVDDWLYSMAAQMGLVTEATITSEVS